MTLYQDLLESKMGERKREGEGQVQSSMFG
jgi:hypothetical protein